MVSSRVAAIHLFAAFLWSCLRPSPGLSKGSPGAVPGKEGSLIFPHFCRWLSEKWLHLFDTWVSICVTKENAYFPSGGWVDSTKSSYSRGMDVWEMEISTFWSPMHIQELGDTEAQSERTGAFHSLLCSLKLLLIHQEIQQHLLFLTHSTEVLSMSPCSHRNKWVLLEWANTFLICKQLQQTGPFLSPWFSFEGNQSFMSEQQNQGWYKELETWILRIKGNIGSLCMQLQGLDESMETTTGIWMTYSCCCCWRSVPVPCPIPHHPSRSGSFIPLSAFLLKPIWFLLPSSLEDCSILSTASTWRKPSLFCTQSNPQLSQLFLTDSFPKNLSFLDTLCIYPAVQYPSFPPLQMFGYTLCLLPQTVTKYLRFLVCLVFLFSSESKQGKKNKGRGNTLKSPSGYSSSWAREEKIPFLTPFLATPSPIPAPPLGRAVSGQMMALWGDKTPKLRACAVVHVPNLQPFVSPYCGNVLEKCRLIPCTDSNPQLPPERDWKGLWFAVAKGVRWEEALTTFFDTTLWSIGRI